MILALDSATRVVSIAVYDGEQILAESTWQTTNHHTVELTPVLSTILNRVGLSIGDFHAVGVALGPGSYTGLRIGMSLAKGLSLSVSNPLPVVGIPTLDIVASAQPHLVDKLCAVAQAGRGRVNAGFYIWTAQGWQAVSRPYITTCAEIAETIYEPTQFTGELDREGLETLGRLGKQAVIAPPEQRIRRAGYLAALVHRRLHDGEQHNAASLSPLYLN
nr:tRNA (adenosine(37)-N6)-threonylcarbamoyltransferase complex dimerization subunit type 1 TsaB [Anaerolineae bacterium]